MPGKRGNLYSDEQIAAAIETASGFVSFAAKALGCDRSTIARRVAKSRRLRRVLRDARRRMVDTAALALHNKVLQGDVTAIIFTLKTLGKSEGYVERQEVAKVEPVTLRVVEEIVEAEPDGIGSRASVA